MENTQDKLTGFIKSIIEVSHIEFTSFDLLTEELICSSGLAEKILGYSKEQYLKITNHFFKTIIHPDDMERVMENIKRIQYTATNEISESTARYLKADGEYIWVYTRTIVSGRDSQGLPMKITSVSEDVTAAVLLQEELRKTVEALDKIAYINSHQIRGPVATIMGIMNLLNENRFTTEFDRQCFQYLNITVQKLDAIISNINNLTDLE